MRVAVSVLNSRHLYVHLRISVPLQDAVRPVLVVQGCDISRRRSWRARGVIVPYEHVSSPVIGQGQHRLCEVGLVLSLPQVEPVLQLDVEVFPGTLSQ